jgi:hypothetical protein
MSGIHPRPYAPVSVLRAQDHRESVTLFHVRRRQAGQVIHRSKVRPGNQAPNGNCRNTNAITPTRLIEPHEEHATHRAPRWGIGSAAVAVAVVADVDATDSPAGVASE